MLFGTAFLGFAKLTNLWKMTKTPPKFQGPHLPEPWLQRCCLTSGSWMGIKKSPKAVGFFGGNPYPHGCVSQIKLKVYLVGGFSPTHLKNMLVKIGSSSPSFGVQIKKIENHHQVMCTTTNAQESWEWWLAAWELFNPKKSTLRHSHLPAPQKMPGKIPFHLKMWVFSWMFWWTLFET